MSARLSLAYCPSGLSVDAIGQQSPQIGEQRVAAGIFVPWSGYLTAAVFAPVLVPVVGVSVPDLRSEKLQPIRHECRQIRRIGGSVVGQSVLNREQVRD